MAISSAEAVRRNFLAGFIPSRGLPIFDPPLSEEASGTVEIDHSSYPRLAAGFCAPGSW